MKKILFFLTLITFSSCTKLQDEEETIANEINLTDYFLNFDIADNVYDPANQTNFSVISTQEIGDKLVFLDAYKSRHKYPYFSNDVSPQDSVDIIGAIHFEAEDEFGFFDKFIDFEIVVREAIDNLDQISDSTYTFKSLETLYHKLINNNFGQKNLFNVNDRSTILISIPNDDFENQNLYHSITSSNGFYFEHEDIELTTIDYNLDEKSIELSGNFEVEFKQLSCGFYSTHLLSNAEFSLIIK